MIPEDVTGFWREAGSGRWFRADPTFDGAIAIRFRGALAHARNRGLREWEETAEGALGLVILLDQFSRNIHRGSPLAFAGDARAIAVSRRVIGSNGHRRFPAPLGQWFVMPFEHAEDLDA